MKVVTVVGARPQFIKAAVVSTELRKKHIEVLVHTGQHYDYNMSQQMFDELHIPKPDYNLGISGGTHSQMTSRMMIKLEEVLINEQPDWVLLYGDTNSTLAAALVAAKLHIKICHVEAGPRTNCLTNPEEINRICTDHISTLLLAVTEEGMSNLKKENLSDRSVFVGDPMYDAFLKYKNSLNRDTVKLIGIQGETVDLPNEFYYLTCHREENTNKEALKEILNACQELDKTVIYPVHPRNRDIVKQISGNIDYSNILFCQPVGYLESIFLVNNSIKIVTDSGGLQREAFWAKKKCVTILDFLCWPEIMVGHRNDLAKADSKDIIKKLALEQIIDEQYMPFGDGKSATKIVEEMEKKL